MIIGITGPSGAGKSTLAKRKNTVKWAYKWKTNQCGLFFKKSTP